MFSFSANAGFKASVSPEYTSSVRITSVDYRNLEGSVYKTETFEDKSNNTDARFYWGYQQSLDDKMSVEIGSSLNTNSLTRTELNLLYSVNTDLSVKAGANYTYQVNGEPDFKYKGDVGFQVGGEYSLSDKNFIDFKYIESNDGYDFKDYKDISAKTNSKSFGVGFGVRF